MLAACPEMVPSDREWINSAMEDYGEYTLDDMPLVATSREIGTIRKKASDLSLLVDRVFKRSMTKAAVLDLPLISSPKFSNRQFQEIIAGLLERLDASQLRSGFTDTEKYDLSLLVNRLVYLFFLRKNLSVPSSWKETSGGPRFHTFVKLGLTHALREVPDDALLARIGKSAFLERFERRGYIDVMIKDWMPRLT